MPHTLALLSFCCLFITSQAFAQTESGVSSINEASIRGHVRFLADDLLEGRGPGSRGDELTQLYIATQFETLGLQPAAGNDKWLQPFPLVGVRTIAPPNVVFKKGGKTVSLKSVEDFMSTIGRPAEKARLEDAELVFVGYGIDAPEYNWNDYKDVDLTGKVLVMMNNDPASDPDLFEGRRRLYYGRWDYKYEIAAQKGAAGTIIIHTTPPARYPWQVIQTSWSGEEFELLGNPGKRLELKGWGTEKGLRDVFKMSGFDLDDLRTQAESRDFRPVSLGTTLSIELEGIVRKQNTANVLGMLPGSDPILSDEVLIYMAHHDHLGMGAERDLRGDNIYNGAVDNATGVAALLTMAKAYSEMEPPPKRSILFAAVGAEEQGLLGSRFFAENPTLKPGKMAAVINMDGTNIIGRTHDVNVIGYGKSNLDSIVVAVAKSQKRIVTPDHFPDRGYYYRSDQFSLAKIGVPGVYLHSGIEVVGKPAGWGKQQLDEWVEKTYHQPSDEYSEDWNLSGALEDTRLLYEVGRRIANQATLPAWTPGDEFEAARKAAIISASKPN